MIDRTHDLSIAKQAKALGVGRGAIYYKPRPVSPDDLKIYATIGELQKDLDAWMTEYNEERPHQGRFCFGKTPMQPFLDARASAQDKPIGDRFIAQIQA